MKNKVASGVIWKFIERLSIQLGKFVIQLVLARILVPEEYGIIAILTVYIAVADSIVQGGLNLAIVQAKEVDSTDYSTVLITSFIASIVMYSILFLFAPLISDWYDIPILTQLLRVLSLTLFSGAIYSVEIAYIQRRIQFRLNFISSAIGIVVSGIIGILFAIKGFGVWAIVIQQMSNQVIAVFVLLVCIRKVPRFSFHFDRLRKLFSFGWKVMMSSVIATITENLYNIVLGKIYNVEVLGYYNRGHQFPTVICSSANQTIAGVLLPVFSRKQDDLEELVKSTRKGVRLSCFLIIPLMTGLLSMAPQLIKLLLTDKWLPCVPFLRMECLFYITLAANYVESQAIRAIGKSQVSMYLEITKTLLAIVGIVLLMHEDIFYIMLQRVLISLFLSLIVMYICKKLIGYSIIDQIKDQYKYYIASGIMGFFIVLIGKANITLILLVICQFFSGILIYLFILLLLKDEVVYEFFGFVMRRIREKN